MALDLCLDQPQKVRGVVLVAGVASGFEPSAEMQEFGRKEEELIEAGDLEAATELNLSMWVDGPRRTPDQVDAELRSRVAAMQLEAFMVPIPEGAELIRPAPALDRLDAVERPVLVIAGALDIPAVVEHAKLLAAEIRGARLELVPDAAHLVSMESPASFNALVREFLGEGAESGEASGHGG